jgi:hypothetical protein
MSVGEYFKWATADDRSDAELVRACVEALDRQPDIVLAYGRTRFIDQAGNILAIQDPGWSLDSNLAHERFRRVLFAGHWVNCHYGVIRASTLTKTHLLPNYPGGDYRLLGELSIAGKFHEIPQNLFFRRIHPAASSQNGADRQWMQEFFGKHGSVATPHWRRSADHARSILRSNFSLGQKFSLSLSLLQAMRWRSIHLQRELRELILNFTFRHKHKSLPIARLIVSALLGLGEIGDSYGNFGSNV